MAFKTKDKDIREPLFLFLEKKYGKIRIIEEKKTGKARADVLMVTDNSIFGIEIKSDRDTYERLETQVKNYDKYYDYNMVVVGSSHALHIEEHVPKYWGILSAEIDESTGEMDFYEIREPSLNPKMKIKNKLTILWRPELAHIQEINKMHEYKRESKKFVQDKILEKVSSEDLNFQISQELFERDYNTIKERIDKFREDGGKKPKREKRRYKKA